MTGGANAGQGPVGKRRFEARADQQAVLDFLEGRRAAGLWLPTGSGKSVIAATWLQDWMYDAFEVRRALIVAPRLVAAENWPATIAGWEHLGLLASSWRHVGFEELGLTVWDEVLQSAPGREHKPYLVPRGQVCGPGLVTKQATDFADKAAAKRRLLGLTERLHVCSWEAFPWMAQAYGRNWPYQAVVFDEASFLRDQGSERGRAARHVVHRLGAVTHQLQLAATPNGNHDESVYGQIALIDRGLLGETLTAFRERFCVPDSQNRQTGQVYRWKIAAAARAEFERLCASVSISVPESLGIDVLEVEHPVVLPEQARAVYRELAKSSVLRSPQVTAGSEAVLHNKLRQVATGFVYDDDGAGHDIHDGKRRALAALLEELGHRQALIAFEFDHELAWIKATLGSSFADIRQKGAKARFEAGKLRYLGVHPRSAGHGVDGLQAAANAVVWVTVPEDRELYDQLNGRLKRPGQQAPTVMVHLLVAQDTVEEDVWREVLPAKARRAERLLSAARVQDSQAVV